MLSGKSKGLLKWGFLVGLPLWILSAQILVSKMTVMGAARFLIPFKCPLNFFTGLLCPTCGLGRSLILSLTGRWGQAFELHFLGPPLALLACALWLVVLRGRLDLPRRALGWIKTASSPQLGWTLGLAFCVWGFFRNL